VERFVAADAASKYRSILLLGAACTLNDSFRASHGGDDDTLKAAIINRQPTSVPERLEDLLYAFIYPCYT